MAVLEQNGRLAAALRLVVALGALAIFVLDPEEHPDRRPFVIGVLALFVAYSAVSYVRAMRGARARLALAPWYDVAWVTLAAAVSQATSEIFYPLYLFAILCASFWSGFRRGFVLAVASAVAYAAVGSLTALPGIDQRVFLTRPGYLLVLGYLMAVWGGHELRSRARLRLLRDVMALSSPRFGVDAAVGRILEAVRGVFDADSCRWVVTDELAGRKWVRTALRGRGADGAPAELPPDVAAALLPAPAGAAFLVHAGRRGRTVFALVGRDPSGKGDAAVGAALLTALDARALVSVPFHFHATAPGRLYVTGSRARMFDREDAEFLRHVAEQVEPALESLRLVDRLASDAANEERRRIALDLHDSVIQPYLGLRLGLSAASAALAGGRAHEAGSHIDRLLALADGEIQTLRGYVHDLRADGGTEPAALEAAVRRFCKRFSEATGIRVDLRTAGGPVQDRMATEIFQLVAEALSNVRRHTTAARVEIAIEAADGTLNVTVASDGAPAEPAAFFPRSLAERAAALGGKLSIRRPAAGTTAVHVEVPL